MRHQTWGGSELVETTTCPVVELVETTTFSVVRLVETTTCPVVELVETTTCPVVELVETTTCPVVELVETTTGLRRLEVVISTGSITGCHDRPPRSRGSDFDGLHHRLP